jgi:ABC-2 type transport system ATP-binding protein
MPDPAIRTEGLTKLYPGVRALDDVSFSVEAGEIFGYLGRNGAGKTTTVRILATLTASSSGHAWVGGVEVGEHPAAVRRSVGVAMQSASLDDLMTGREHLTLAARLYGFGQPAARARVGELLETFGLSQAVDRMVATYSGGMRRRLDIAMSLIHRPPILFLDEPTTGLDPQARRALWGTIRELRGGGATVLLTTQYLEEADELADRIAVIDGGRIVASGTPDELKATVGRTTVAFRVLDSGAEGRLRRAAALAPDVSVALDGSWARIELSGNGSMLTDLLVRLREEDVRFEQLSVSEPSLEDVFVRLTGEEMDVSSGSDAAAGVSAVRRFRAGLGS